MPSVIHRAVRTLRAIDGVVFDASEDAIVVPAASDGGFVVRLRMVSDRNFVVEYEGWQHTFDRAEDAYDAVLAQGGRALKSTEHTIKAHPYLSIAIASGIGLLVGRLMSHR